MSSSRNTVRLVKGDILKSSAHAIVNTVNCVGVMGKGVALAFKKKYPSMFDDYVKRCEAGEVKLGQPYVYAEGDKLIVNFPTKQHWRSVSKLEDIESGLRFLREHLHAWGIKSIAVPPLGCGNGQLDWSVVGPTLYRHLREFDVPVDLHVPFEVDIDESQLTLLELASPRSEAVKVEPGALALVEILSIIEQDAYHWPIGRIMFQKLAYFATMAGLPTGLAYEAASYGPFSSDLKRLVARLQNNGVVQERERGRAFEVVVGKTYADARSKLESVLGGEWSGMIQRVADLMTRMDSKQAEVAASVHYVSFALANRFGRTPMAQEVIDGVEKWKIRRNPPILRDEIGRAVVNLATQGWIDVDPDSSVEKYIRELVSF